MTVGLEWAHAEAVRQTKSLVVMGFGVGSVQRMAVCSDRAEEVQRIGLVVPFLVCTGERQRLLGEGVRFLQRAGSHLRLS